MVAVPFLSKNRAEPAMLSPSNLAYNPPILRFYLILIFVATYQYYELSMVLYRASLNYLGVPL